jgi:hypothetical protein
MKNATPLLVLAALALIVAATCLTCSSLPQQDTSDLPYRTGTTHLYPDGSIDSHELAQDHVIQGRLIPAGSRVFHLEDGVFKGAWLAKDMTYDGIPCNGGFGKIYTGFHSNGKVKTAFLSHDTVIQGVPCEASLFTPANFATDGKLLSCMLSDAWDSHGVKFAAGDRITFDANGIPSMR